MGFHVEKGDTEESAGWLVGYARVSTDEQSVDMQVAALEKARVDQGVAVLAAYRKRRRPRSS